MIKGNDVLSPKYMFPRAGHSVTVLHAVWGLERNGFLYLPGTSKIPWMDR